MKSGINKWLIMITELLILENMSFAVPAWPNLSAQKQPDGTPFQMRLKGDEFFKWHETSDGYSILLDKSDGFWKYAKTSANKSGLELIPGGVVGTTDPESMGLVPGILPDSEIIRETVIKKRREQQYSILPKDISTPPARVPIADATTIKNIVILAAFSDHWDEENGTVLETYGHVDTGDYEDLFNEVDYSTDQAVGSVRDYYNEISYGHLNIESIVSPWVYLPEDEAYYGENDLDGSDLRPRQMASDAVEAAAKIGFDFSQGDSDNDGWVDCLTIIHSGHGEEWAGNPANLIWSHRWGLVNLTTKNDTNMFRYHTSPALRGDISNDGIARIGVICHELGHFFGLPDLYDPCGQTMGIGNWGIMALGAWNGGDGRSPAHFCAWSKKMLGLLQPAVMHSNIDSELLSTTIFPSCHLYRDGMTNGEYFLLGNRTNDGFDNAEEITPGILIYHIYDYSSDNDLDTWSHPVVKIEEADGNDSLGAMKINASEAGDVWHSSNGIVGGFRDQTGNQTVNAMSYQSHCYQRADIAASYSYVSLSNFSEPGRIMTYDAMTLLPAVSNRTVGQSDFDISWTESTNAADYELQEGTAIILSSFSDGAESEEEMLNNWYLRGSVQRSDAGNRTGNYSYVMQVYDGTRFYSTVQSMTLRTPFSVDDGTLITFYFLDDLNGDAGYLKVQISNDSGTTWHTLDTIKGDATSWIGKAYDHTDITSLGIYTGDACIIRFIANFEVCYGGTAFPAFGFAIDDISIENTAIDSYGNWNTLSNSITETRYTITGKGEGEYAYRVRAYANDKWQRYGEPGVITVSVDAHTVTFQTDGTPDAYLSGQLVQLISEDSVGTPVTAVPPESHEFSGWVAEDRLYSNDNPIEIMGIDSDITLVATFTAKPYEPELQETTYVLEVTGNGNGTISLDGTILTLPWTGEKTANTTIILQALPEENYEFVTWFGTIVSSDNPITFDMNQNHSISALFDPVSTEEGEWIEVIEGEGYTNDDVLGCNKIYQLNEDNGEGELETGDGLDNAGWCNSVMNRKKIWHFLGDWLLI